MTYPQWLPELFSVHPWTDSTYSDLHHIFVRDFIDSQPLYQEQAIWFFPEVEDGKHVIFWHLTTKDDELTGQRLPDLRRCERLPWVRPILCNSPCPKILDWDYEEGDGTTKTYVWLKEHDFVVILKKYPNGSRRLITSFWVEHPHTKRRLIDKYNHRIGA